MAAADLAIPAGELAIAHPIPQTWPDSCLGLATANEMCAQVLVDGWQVEVVHGADTWVYRTDQEGRIIRQASSGNR